MKKLLIAAVAFFALSAAAFAQSSFTVASTPESFVACCGLTEETGDIAFTAVPGTPDSVAGTLTVTYQVPITATAGISVTAVAGSIGGVSGSAPVVSIASTTPTADGKGQVVIAIQTGGIAPYTIRLNGVRANVSGACSGSVSANITSTGNLLTSGETNVVVISNVAQALRTPTVPLSGAMAVNSVTGRTVAGLDLPQSINVSVKENFLDAFGKISGALGDPSANISKMIRLTVSKVPVGLTVSFPVSAGMFTLAAPNGTLAAAPAVLGSSTSPGAVYYRLTTNSDPTVLESLVVPVTVDKAFGATFPLPSGSVTVSAHIAPFDSAIVPTLVPRYADDAACETGTVTFLTVQGASTTLLMPYAVNSAGYDTGIEVANTTTDPGTALMGFTQAVRQSGSLTFYFYPQTSTAVPFSYATVAGSPGAGLASDGTLATGRIYTVMLSQLLAAANAPADFSGYIVVITNFTNAHGQYFISDFEFFTNGALMLVLNNPSVGRANPEVLGN